MTSSSAASTVSVWPARAAGRSTATSTASPGQTRHTRRWAPSCSASSGAGPAAWAQAKRGLQCRCQASVHGAPAGACSVMRSDSRSVLSQLSSGRSASRVSRAAPPSSTTAGLVGASPGSSGTDRATGASPPPSRRTTVTTRHGTPSSMCRSTWIIG